MSLPSRLYAILDVESTRAIGLTPLDLLDLWLDSGVRLVQLRAKALPAGEMLELADGMASRCRRAGAAWIVNDRADVARMAGADGVHIGLEDLPPAAARSVLGEDAWIGYSTHSAAQAEVACREPATYLAIGPTFATTTKTAAGEALGLAGVRRAAAIAHDAGRPLVAIGGITLATAAHVLDAGADAVAVIADLLVGRPVDRVREYLAALR
jgi:thiamine-phosphate pyrophosphorylase